MTDESGNKIQLLDYYPFGGLRLNETDALDEQRKFTGHEYDDDTDLTYANARYYDQGIGRFTSQDPVAAHIPETFLADPQRLNTYSYVRNNPLKLIDPTGLYDIEKGQVEKGDTQESIVSTINDTFGIDTNWSTVQEVSFYGDRFGDKSLDQIVGESLYIGTNITTDITGTLDRMNSSRSAIANILGIGSLALFGPNMSWDVKNSSDDTLGGGETNRGYWSYIYNSQLIRYDAPGNINYGYVASSLGLGDSVIQGGARLVQIASDLFRGKVPSFSDNRGDSKYIQKGINLGASYRTFSGSLFNW